MTIKVVLPDRTVELDETSILKSAVDMADMLSRLDTPLDAQVAIYLVAIILDDQCPELQTTQELARSIAIILQNRGTLKGLANHHCPECEAEAKAKQN